jgi:hypothetical protein
VPLEPAQSLEGVEVVIALGREVVVAVAVGTFDNVVTELKDFNIAQKPTVFR